MVNAKDWTKVLTFTVTALIAVGGAVLLGLCIWLYVDTDSMIRYVARVMNHWVFTAAFFCILAAGALTVLFAVMGFCGAGFEQRCCIATYMVFMLVVLLALLTGASFAFIYRNEISDSLVDSMSKGLISDYGVYLDEEKNRELTQGWDRIQEAFECCGVFGDVKSEDSWYIWQSRSQWSKVQALPGEKVPLSCCVVGGGADGKQDRGTCQGTQYIEAPPNILPSQYTSTKNNPALYVNGCYDSLQSFLSDNSLILGAIAFAVAVLIVLGIVASACMFRYISKEHSASRRAVYEADEMYYTQQAEEAVDYTDGYAPPEIYTNKYNDMSMQRFDL